MPAERPSDPVQVTGTRQPSADDPPRPSASPAARAGLAGLGRRLRYPLLGLTASGLTLLGLQLLVGRQLARQQIGPLASGVAANLVLAQVALERFSPEALAGLSGMRLTVGTRPGGNRQGGPADGRDGELLEQTRRLRAELCRRLSPCPQLQPSAGAERGVWVELNSALETVWLFVPLPAAVRWPPDPWLLSLSLGIGGLAAGAMFQVLEVQRPLRQLEEACGRVSHQMPSAPLAQRGTASVRQLTRRFNAMVGDLERDRRERTTMLAGIAHDLRAPLTRLRLRLQLVSRAAASPGPDGTAAGPMDLAAADADLDALERITRQFLVFAGADRQERPVRLPLQELLAEAAAVTGDLPLELDLQPLQRRVRPTDLARAVSNLLENAGAHGRPPLRLVLRAAPAPPQAIGTAGGEDAEPEGFEIQVWDHGAGIRAADWPEALTPFRRLDGARGGRGHSGLGLAIAERIARDHGGGLRRLEADNGFGVALWGRSLPPA